MTSEAARLGANGLPRFEDLPLRKQDPPYSAWGLYGPKDELGTLNRLTDENVVAAARAEIQTGRRFCLDHPMGLESKMNFFHRAKFHQQIVRAPEPIMCNDDIWTFNSQSGSQWDGLRHFAYQKEAQFYNGITMRDIHEPDAQGQRSICNGIHAFSERGIVGRGILLDYHEWRLKQTSLRPFSPLQSDEISLAELKQVAQDQGTKIQFGDILLVRSGFTQAVQHGDPAVVDTYRTAPDPAFCGVEQTEDVLRWIWENLSAVAGDHPTFEVWPETALDYKLHEILLSGWGMPIGELFNLEVLAAHGKEVGRYSFFISSEPCRVVGGIASPPNILAIF
ncbi:hypothetical protein SCUCBS95973_003693 [Sporothrix curviconia]|uniref:Cyclase n=1 Tax=Sporothrix curviconia TaxID=1260050 RepID=A0ABP0BIV6_9PEZI